LRQMVDDHRTYTRMGEDLAAHTSLIKDPKGDPSCGRSPNWKFRSSSRRRPRSTSRFCAP
jgi:hypothetical protein